MGFTTKEGMVRGDLFKKHSGKWAYTVSFNMSKFYHGTNIVDAVKQAIRTPGAQNDVYESTVAPGCGYYLVVLEPYHEHSHPVMVDLDAE